MQALPWDDVRLFLSLMRTRRLAATGAQLGFDTSTASRRLVRLEASLGVTLFDRTRTGLEPTAAAHRLLPSAEEMERASHAFTRELDGFEREAEGVVTLSVPPGVGEAFVAPVLSRLVTRHPKLRFELDASTRQVDLARREADLAVRTVRPSGGPLVRQLLTKAQWVPMASPACVATWGRLRAWDEVPWVGWGFELARLHAARWLAGHVKAPPLLRTNSFQTQVSALRSGLGAALIPEPYASVLDLAPLRLSRALVADTASLPVDELWLVTHEALRKVPRVAATWDFLVAAFR
ncbi:MAG: LysR family transcriptional regulator [Myxococcota bacterium]